MRILNVHDRTFAVGPDDLGPLIGCGRGANGRR